MRLLLITVFFLFVTTLASSSVNAADGWVGPYKITAVAVEPDQGDISIITDNTTLCDCPNSCGKFSVLASWPEQKKIYAAALAAVPMERYAWFWVKSELGCVSAGGGHATRGIILD